MKKILIINKRFCSGNDTILSKSGRVVELGKHLKYFRVFIYSLDHRNRKYFWGKINKMKFVVSPFKILNLKRIIDDITSFALNNKIDLILATNNPIFGFIGYRVSKNLKKPFIYDLMDYYPSYKPNIPFISILDNFLIRRANIVISVSNTLSNKIRSLNKNIIVIQNGIDPSIFYPISKNIARRKLDWSVKDKIILYSGGIARERGIEILIEAFSKMRQTDKKIKLFLLGPNFIKVKSRTFAGVSYIGKVPRDTVNLYLNGADLLVIPNLDNDFTRYCFPLKLMEYAATNKPIVATHVGDTRAIFKGYEGVFLVSPNNSKDLAKKMFLAIKKKRINFIRLSKNYSWEKLAHKLESKLNLLPTPTP